MIGGNLMNDIGRTVRKVAVGLAIAAASVGIVACGGSTKNPPSSPAGQAPQSPATTAPASPTTHAPSSGGASF
jgi:hypothetical protein